jgi:hypothetical protein
MDIVIDALGATVSAALVTAFILFALRALT